MKFSKKGIFSFFKSFRKTKRVKTRHRKQKRNLTRRNNRKMRGG